MHVQVPVFDMLFSFPSQNVCDLQSSESEDPFNVLDDEENVCHNASPTLNSSDDLFASLEADGMLEIRNDAASKDLLESLSHSQVGSLSSLCAFGVSLLIENFKVEYPYIAAGRCSRHCIRHRGFQQHYTTPIHTPGTVSQSTILELSSVYCSCFLMSDRNSLVCIFLSVLR